jgi:predicted enzyme related to lactoylglutathione lyase
MITTIGSVPIFVSDQSRALEFFTKKLGFEVAMDMPFAQGLRWLTVTPRKGGTEFVLFPPEMANGGSAELKERVGTWTGIIILSDDCRGDYASLVKSGVKFTAEPKQPFWGGWIAELSDDDGNRFQLVERPAFMR